jgi:D-3-phosphoglycerate dehydrogenase / 2-oxoglutarate reductase
VAEELPLIVVADPIDASAIRALSEGPCRVVDASAGAAALAPHVGEMWGLIVRSRTQVDRALFDRAPKLRIVARAGVGVDNIDMPVATEHGVRVVNAPTAATTSVAELSLAFYLWLTRELSGPVAATRAGTWKRGTHGHEISGRTVGFVGYGRIARETAVRAKACGMTAIAHDPFVPSAPDGTRMVSLEELLKTADIVSLHAALTKENHHLLNAERFALMKRGALVVNVARGALVDEAALLAALESKQVGGAALDVYEAEPPTRKALLEHPNVIPTPHLGASTHEAQARAGAMVVAEVLRAVRHEPLQFQVNPEVHER